MVLAFNFTPTQKPREYFALYVLIILLQFHPPSKLPLVCFYFILQLLHLLMTFIMMTTMKSPRGKMPLSVIAIIICSLAFMALLYTERISFLSCSTIFRFKPYAAQHKASKTDKKRLESKPIDYADDDRFEFDPEECSITNGKWAFNHSIKPSYTDETCPYLDRQFSCVKNGRNDTDYLHWFWQPDDCMLPSMHAALVFSTDWKLISFNPETALKKLQGKRLMFAGDSLQRGQWQSFVCLVESIIPKSLKSMKRGRVHSVFKAKEYNATIEFYWAPFLIESNSDVHIIGDPKQRILRVDSIDKHAKNWIGVDILVFNTYVWWMSGLKIKSLWGTFSNGEEGFEELDAPVAYRIGLKTWANWVDSTIDPNKTRVFFTTMSPTHQRSQDWGNKDGIRCFNETKPIRNKRHWGSGSDIRMMNVVGSIGEKMRIPVTFLNITQLSEYRVDAHTSIYTEMQGQLLTDDQKADPLRYADCIHWCLPGVPDTWNQLLFAHL